MPPLPDEFNEHAARADNPNMTISSLIKMSFAAIAVPPVVWLAGASPDLAGLAGVVTAVVLVACACVHVNNRRTRRRARTAPLAFVSPVAPSEAAIEPELMLEFPRRRLYRPPVGRQPRDVRCPAHRPLGTTRPSTRRSTRR